MRLKRNLWIILLGIIWVTGAEAGERVDLSGLKWRIWLDRNAEWEAEKLHLPPVDIGQIAVQTPGCGWDSLAKQKDLVVTTLPATVEEHFWGQNGSSHGIAGDYVGVSWFVTEVKIPRKWSGKRIVLEFESVRMRAEVYWNRKLVGYDLIHGTSFEVDISEEADPKRTNELAVRITDPNGNFGWRDWETYSWGDQETPPSHGFGGITGKVRLHCTDATYIGDVFIKNRPNPEQVDVEVEMRRRGSGDAGSGELRLEIVETKNPKKVLFSQKAAVEGSTKVTIPRVGFDGSRLWDLDHPGLYELKVGWVGQDGSADEWTGRFGFRWFGVTSEAGDSYFTLNGKRVFLLGANSLGFWPGNGIYPTESLARKQMQTARLLGLNLLSFHRSIGQTLVLDQADEIGMLIHAEPGGYRPGTSEFAKAWKREKWLRMVRQFRNHPSLVIYNLINEAARNPMESEIEDLRLAHRIDETRYKTFTSTYIPGREPYHGVLPVEPAPIKLHLRPYSEELLFQGWWDTHHADGPGTYQDALYNSPTDFKWFSENRGEIVFWGDEGATGALPRLDWMRKPENALHKPGWDGEHYQQMARSMESFLSRKGFLKSFGGLDGFTMKMGEVSYYHHGRVIENMRIGDVSDAYIINGWEGSKVENHSGIVDSFRNPKADPTLLNRYSQDLYVAVKLRNKVMDTGMTAVCDLFLHNRVNLQGSFRLEVVAEDASGKREIVQREVEVSGGNRYGELLLMGVEVEVQQTGYTKVLARLSRDGRTVSSGEDSIFAVDNAQSPVRGVPLAVIDTSGEMQKVLLEMGLTIVDYVKGGVPREEKTLIVGGGKIQPGFINSPYRKNEPILDWVARGNTLMVLQDADLWARFLKEKGVLDYRGAEPIGVNWLGGNYFVREHPLFGGLPVNTAFNWEYQSLAGYVKRQRLGLRLEGEECVVGAFSGYDSELYSVVGIVPCGEGRILLSALDLMGAIQEENPANAVAKRLLLNYLEFAVGLR
jgi:beta-galactosidase